MSVAVTARIVFWIRRNFAFDVNTVPIHVSTEWQLAGNCGVPHTGHASNSLQDILEKSQHRLAIPVLGTDDIEIRGQDVARFKARVRIQ